MNSAPLLLAVGMIGVVIQCFVLGRRWAEGGAANVDWKAGILRLPQAYFGTVHNAVARDPYASRMHAMTAGGLMGALLLSMLLSVFGGTVLAVGVVAMAVLALAGIAMVAWRRLGRRQAHLSRGSFNALPFALAALTAVLAGDAIRQLSGWIYPVWTQVILAGIGTASLLWLVGTVIRGPMRHAVAGAVHLVAHTRPDRFKGMIDSALMPVDLEASRLGANEASDFSWNRLASYDACVQCGRCEAACPAFAAGQPLNPKKLINDLVRGSGTLVGDDYAGNCHPGEPRREWDVPPGPFLIQSEQERGFIAPETLWACTTCRACVHECPMLIEHVDAIVDMRRYQTMEIGTAPEKVVVALTNLRATDTLSARRLDTRLDWAADLGLPVLKEQGSCDVLLWLGDSAFDMRNQRTLRALVRLLKMANVQFAVLGDEERDVGDLARRLGDEATFQALARLNIETLRRYRFTRIVTADPHVLHCLAKEYGAFGASWPVMHHTTFLEELVNDGRLSIGTAALDGAVTFHDPCYLGRYSGEVEAPRRLLERAGVNVSEMTRSGFRSSCCGGGGGAPLSDVSGTRRIPDMRMDQARSTGASILAVACPYCAQMFEGVAGMRPDVMDIAEILVLASERRS